MAVAEISQALLTDVKAYVDFTWQDEALETKYKNFIRAGMYYINDKLGEPADYESDGFPRTLLFEYVRYARDGATDVFENNYLSMILAMQNNRKVSAYAEKNTVSTEQRDLPAV